MSITIVFAAMLVGCGGTGGPSGIVPSDVGQRGAEVAGSNVVSQDIPAPPDGQGVFDVPPPPPPGP